MRTNQYAYDTIFTSIAVCLLTGGHRPRHTCEWNFSCSRPPPPPATLNPRSFIHYLALRLERHLSSTNTPTETHTRACESTIVARRRISISIFLARAHARNFTGSFLRRYNTLTPFQSRGGADGRPSCAPRMVTNMVMTLCVTSCSTIKDIDTREHAARERWLASANNRRRRRRRPNMPRGFRPQLRISFHRWSAPLSSAPASARYPQAMCD